MANNFTKLQSCKDAVLLTAASEFTAIIEERRMHVY